MAQAHKNDKLLSGRQAGVYLHIASLPGPYGIGEIGAHARAFVDAMVDMRLSVWQFLPLGPTGYGDSPYQPFSTFAGNENLVDIGHLVELGLLHPNDVEELRELPEDTVDYGTLIPVKKRLLNQAAGRFASVASDDLRTACHAFCSTHDGSWLHDYALFRILKDRHGQRPWPEWEPQYARRDPDAIAEIEAGAGDQIAAIKVIQFLFFHQWQALRRYANERGVRLLGDMPIYIALDSADAWAHPEILRVDDEGRPSFVAGVPPDYYSEDGQLWGNPLYDWERHAADGYAWWIDRVRATIALVDIVRIDHFRGFEAYWAVPADAETARTGAWEPGPNGAIFDAMRDALGSLPIVAEDLGVITPPVEALRDAYDMPGMVVLQFEVADPDFVFDDIRRNSVCYTGTHDNDTTLGWFIGSPGDIRSEQEILDTRQRALEMTGGTPETISLDLVRLAFASNSKLAVAPVQDYLGLGSEARINIPGTSANNWRWRLRVSQLTHEVCDNVSDLVRQSGRALT